MTYKDFIKKLQAELNSLGEHLDVDGDAGPMTIGALEKYDASVIAALKPVTIIPPIVNENHSHLSPIDWARGELGQKEILGVADNPRIRWYHTHCANIGSIEYPDEVPWCSSFLNAAADECGCEKTDNALAGSWKNYGVDSGAYAEEGDIVVIGDEHVTLANKPFNRYNNPTFEGLGGNQGNMVKVSTFACNKISAIRKWVPKPGTTLAPIMTKP